MSGRAGAASFGDVTGEYVAIRNEVAYVTSWHEIVWVRGPDAVSFLDGLVSQAIAPMQTGAVARSLLLSPQGKLRVPHVVLRGDDEIGLVTDPGCGAMAAGDLRRFKIRVDAAIEPEPAPVIGLWGPDARGAVTRLVGAAPPGAGWQRREGLVVAEVPFRRGGPDRFLITGLDPADIDAAGVTRAGSLAADAVRIEAGEALTGVDIDDGTIPQEADLVEGAVDFGKGCYLGQELVARIDSRGRVNRHLRGIRLASNVLPPVGAEVAAGERSVGTVTSVAESLELRAPIGLALLRREVEPQDAVQLEWEGGGAEAIVVELPFL